MLSNIGDMPFLVLKYRAFTFDHVVFPGSYYPTYVYSKTYNSRLTYLKMGIYEQVVQKLWKAFFVKMKLNNNHPMYVKMGILEQVQKKTKPNFN